ncbi:hypothetical protein C0J52_11589 [Blattella germanica]|nr:hypothetical protein C0J52_11589 [Blattella germanica]
MKSPPKKRENSIDRGFEGESVIIRYVPVLKNGGHNSVFYGTNSNEDSDLLQSYYDEQLTHSSHNEECPHCKNRYTHPYYHHHNHHHHEYEENTPNYTYQQHPSTYPHIDDSQDLTRTADVLSQYYNVPTLDYSITEHPISQMTTDHKIGQNHLRHFTDLHEILDETHSPHSEEVKDVVTSPTTDIQQAGRRGRYLELKASEGIPDETMAHVMGHQVARDYGDNSEDTTKANEETLMGLEDSGMKATDVLGILTKSPISVGGQK